MERRSRKLSPSWSRRWNATTRPLQRRWSDGDAGYKQRGIELDQECMILQARQAPVAGDLRLIYTVQALTNHMVRAGTLTEHISVRP